MSGGQTKPEIKWVPLAEAPFKLSFGWERPDSDEERPNGTKTFGDRFGWVSIFRTARNYFFIECRGTDDIVRVAFPIGDYAYLGADARLSPAEIAAQGDFVNLKRTKGAIDTALRLAILEGQLGLRARKGLDGDFTDIPPSAMPELKFTTWSKGRGEYSTGERLFDIQARLLQPKEAGHDHTFSRRMLMTIDPMALRLIRPDNPSQSVPAAESPSIVPSESAPNKEHQDRGVGNAKRPSRPRGRNYEKADRVLVDEMRDSILRGEFTSPTKAAASLASRAIGVSVEAKIRRLVGHYSARFRDDP